MRGGNRFVLFDAFKLGYARELGTTHAGGVRTVTFIPLPPNLSVRAMRSITPGDFRQPELGITNSHSSSAASTAIGEKIHRPKGLLRWILCAAVVLVVQSPAAWGQSRSILHPAEANSETEQIHQLIRELGSEDYFQRQRAQQLLSSYGAKAFDALVAAQSHPDIEIAARAKFLLNRIEFNWEHESDDPDVQRILKGYGNESEETRLQRAEQLALLPCDLSAGPLTRIARFEPSETLSRRAALLLIRQKSYSDTIDRRRREAIVEKLGPSQRVAAQWLHTFVKESEAPRVAAAEWAQYVDQARKAYQRRRDGVSERQLLLGLVQYQAELLTRLGESDQAQPMFAEVVELSPASSDSLLQLFRWLNEQRGFAALDELENRHKDVISAQPLLMYALAEARDQQGETEASVQWAAKAAAASGEDSLRHLREAYFLRQSGLMKWAEQEFRIVTRLVPATHSNALSARFLLAETLHDMGRHLDAAKLFEEAVAAMEKNEMEGAADQNGRREVSTARSRMYYFYARHYDGVDRKKHEEYLERAIAIDATDADALIALYRLPDQTEEQRARVSLLIRSAVIAFRKQIEQEPDNATSYNQLAWLVGNTEGDYQEAVKASLKSLEFQAGTAAYLDTLGRCYYAAGDLENAVKHQIMAVEREPFSEQMQRQLKLFLEKQEAGR